MSAVVWIAIGIFVALVGVVGYSLAVNAKRADERASKLIADRRTCEPFSYAERQKRAQERAARDPNMVLLRRPK